MLSNSDGLVWISLAGMQDTLQKTPPKHPHFSIWLIVLSQCLTPTKCIFLACLFLKILLLWKAGLHRGREVFLPLLAYSTNACNSCRSARLKPRAFSRCPCECTDLRTWAILVSQIYQESYWIRNGAAGTGNCTHMGCWHFVWQFNWLPHNASLYGLFKSNLVT